MNRLATRCTCRPKVLVEFLGASGIGKSRLLGKLAEELHNRNIAVRNLDDLSLKKENLRAFRKVLQIAWIALRLRLRNFRVYLKIVRRLARVSLIPRTSSEVAEVFIRSEGVFHILRTIARQSRSKDMYKVASRVFAKAHLPDVIVILEASAQTIYAQRLSRGRPGDAFTLESIETDICTTHESIRVIEEFRRQRHPEIQVIRCNLDQMTTRHTVNLIATIVEESVTNP
jgi:hypothetical protein